MLDTTSVIETVIGFFIFGIAFGYVLGKLGIAGIESDISTIKGLLSGQSKVAIVTPVADVSTPAVTTAHAGTVA